MTENQEWVFNAIRFERTVHLCIKDFEGWKYRYVPLPLNEDDILDFAGRWESSNDIYKKQVEGKMAQFVREYETDTIENKGIVERQLNYTIKWLPENEKWLKLITYSLKIQDESLAKNELEGDTLRAVTKQRKDLYRAFNVMKTCIEMAKWLKYEIVDKLPATPQVDKDKKAEVVYQSFSDLFIKPEFEAEALKALRTFRDKNDKRVINEANVWIGGTKQKNVIVTWIDVLVLREKLKTINHEHLSKLLGLYFTDFSISESLFRKTNNTYSNDFQRLIK